MKIVNELLKLAKNKRVKDSLHLIYSNYILGNIHVHYIFRDNEFRKV